jgi:nickel-dependent lactate racemase
LPLSDSELSSLFTDVLRGALAGLEAGAFVAGPAKSRGPGPVLILPPDLTRIHSRAGVLTAAACTELTARPGWSLGAIMPALGTHRPLTPEETAFMFPGCPADKFVPHRWREDTVELGRLEADWVQAAFEGTDRPEKPDGSPFYVDWPVQVNRMIRDGLPAANGGSAPFSLIVSIGQVVPHEIAGMANHAKNIFVGSGGAEAINKSHYLGALYGQERLLGRAENPVRALFDEAFRRFGALLPPVLWALTVVDGAGAVQGLFAGFGRDCFEKAAALSARVNITRLDEAPRTIVVWLDPAEYRSTWLGNKAVYRTRMAIADGGELVILAPGIACFGEDSGLDALIRRYGYRGADAVRQAAAADAELAANLSAAAHLIHGSSEGRFTVRYCTPPRGGGLSRAAIESAGYQWGDLDAALRRYGLEDLAASRTAPVTEWRAAADGERDYFVSNPALGLWVHSR